MTEPPISVDRIRFVNYESEAQMADIIDLIKQDLSEPYSIYTYRYFIYNWGKLCYLAYDGNECVGAIVCKLEPREKVDQHVYRRHMNNYIDQTERGLQPDESQQVYYKGYIAMLAVRKGYRKLKIGTKLVLLAVQAMKDAKADEVVLETEVVNESALRLYENLGFLRDKRLFRYYLNGLDALRLKLWMI